MGSLKTVLVRKKKQKNGRRAAKVQGHSEKRMRGIQKAASKRGKHLKIPFILIENREYFELNKIDIL